MHIYMPQKEKEKTGGGRVGKETSNMGSSGSHATVCSGAVGSWAEGTQNNVGYKCTSTKICRHGTRSGDVLSQLYQHSISPCSQLRKFKSHVSQEFEGNSHQTFP